MSNQITLVLTIEGRQYTATMDTVVGKNAQLDKAQKDASASARQLATDLDRSAAGARNAAAGSNDAARALDREAQNLKLKTALLGNTSEAVRVQQMYEQGYYGNATVAQKQRLVELAQEYDARQRLLNQQNASMASATQQQGLLRSLGLDFGTTDGRAAALRTTVASLGMALGLAFAVDVVQRVREVSLEFDRATRTLEAVTDSSTLAAREMGRVDIEAERLGLRLPKTANSWAAVMAAAKGTALEGQKARDIFADLEGVTQKLNRTQAETDRVMLAVTQIMSKGSVQAEELRGQIGEVLPGAFQAAARAMGVTTAELNDMLQKGEVISDEFLPKFTAEMARAFGVENDTRIRSNTANFNRLANEISMLADGIGGPLNDALGTAAGTAAAAIRGVRTAFDDAMHDPVFAAFLKSYLPGGALLQPRWDTGRGGDPLNTAPLAPRSPADVAGSTAAYLQGLGRLSAGADFASQFKEAPESDEAAKQREILALMRLKSEEERVRYQIGRGSLKDLDDQAKAYALQIARQRDLDNAVKASARGTGQEQREADRMAEQGLKRLIASEESDRKTLINTRAKTAQLQYEFDTGEKITQARALQIQLETEAQPLAAGSLQAELEKADAIERQVRMQREAQQLAGQIIQRGQRGESVRDEAADIRRTGKLGGMGAGDAVAREVESAKDSEVERYNHQLQQLEEFNRQKLLSNQLFNESAAGLEREHVDRLLAIDKAGEDAKRTMKAQAFDALADLGEAFQQSVFAQTKEGFELAKAISIVQTTIKTYELAVSSYNALAGIPYIGPALGIAAAATATAFGLAQVAAINKQEFTAPGREYGGDIWPGYRHPVGERGRPELLESKGNFYLIDPTGGNVQPAQRAGSAGAGAQLNVSVHDYAGAGVRVERMSDNDIRILVGQAMGATAAAVESRVAKSATDIGSPLSRGLRQVHRTRPRALS